MRFENNAKYDVVYTYTKKANLSKWYATQVASGKMSYSELAKERYSRERTVELKASLRYDSGNHAIACVIHCPINPMPVMGEFTLPCLEALDSFLVKEGWVFKQKEGIYWFK